MTRVDQPVSGQRTLCIGGPLDGKFVGWTGNTYLAVEVVSQIELRQVEYRADQWRTKFTDKWVYVYGDPPSSDYVLAALSAANLL